jgi:hypothetical protein
MTQTTTTAAAADPLEALAAQAASLEQTHDAENPPEGDAQPIPQLTNAQAIAGAIGAGREAFCFFTKLNSPRRVLDDATVSGLGELWAPVLDKHGISLGDYLGDYALEIAAVIGTVAIAAQLRTAINAEIKAQTVDEEKAAAPAAHDAQA